MSSGLIGTIRNEQVKAQADAQSDNVLRAVEEELFAPAPDPCALPGGLAPASDPRFLPGKITVPVPVSKIDMLLENVAAIRRRLDDVETLLSLIDARLRVQVTQQAILSQQVQDLQVSADSVDESIGAFERVLEEVAEGAAKPSQIDVLVLDFGGR